MKKLFLVIAIGISLFAARTFVFNHANSATSVTHKAPLQNVRFVKVRLLMTAYVPRKGRKTATGGNANHPGIAAAFHIFHPGTRIFLPGRGTFDVDDTGGAMRQDAKKGIIHIDLRIPRYHRDAYRRAMAIGKQWVDAYIVVPSTTFSPHG